MFKATGVTGRTLAWGLAVQAIVLALLATVVAIILSIILTPFMPIRVELPLSALLLMPLIAIVISIIASLFGLRRAVSVDPAARVRWRVMSPGSGVQVRDLVIEYSSGGYKVRPIDGLTLDASEGELVLLLGASGCGKTTLLSVLAAILTPASQMHGVSHDILSF